MNDFWRTVLGSGLVGAGGGNPAIAMQLVQQQKDKEAQRKAAEQLGQAFAPQPDANFPSPTSPTDPAPTFGTKAGMPDIKTLAPLLLANPQFAGPVLEMLKMMQPDKASLDFAPSGELVNKSDPANIGRNFAAPARPNVQVTPSGLAADLNDPANIGRNFAAPVKPEAGTAAHQDAVNLGLQQGTPQYNAYMRERTLPKPNQININQPPSGYAPDPSVPGGLMPVPGGPADPTRPTAPNDAQAAAGGFADRAKAAQAVITKYAETGVSLINRQLEGGGIGNYVLSDAAQLRGQAERDFLNAVLRRESGAVINPDEFTNGQLQYFPQPGDRQPVLDQKKKNRDTAVQGLQRSAGPSYKPPADEPKASGGPKPGAVEDGYRFKGGNPADPNAWERVS